MTVRMVYFYYSWTLLGLAVLQSVVSLRISRPTSNSRHRGDQTPYHLADKSFHFLSIKSTYTFESVYRSIGSHDRSSLQTISGSLEAMSRGCRAKMESRIDLLMSVNIIPRRLSKSIPTTRPHHRITGSDIQANADSVHTEMNGLYQTKSIDSLSKQHISQSKLASPFRSQAQDKFLQMLTIYKNLHGHLLICQNYVIPRDDNWPEIFWGHKLGLNVNKVRYQATKAELHPDIVRKLDDIGFIWNVLDYKFQRHCRAVATYKSLFCNTPIQVKFIVPSTAEWDRDLHGYNLGFAVHRVRSGRLFADQIKQETEKLSYNPFQATLPWVIEETEATITKSLNRKVVSYHDDTLTAAETNLAAQALRIYRQIYPYAPKIPFKYIINSKTRPHNDSTDEGIDGNGDEFPPEMHNLRLGHLFSKIKTQAMKDEGVSKNYMKLFEVLKELGFSRGDFELSKVSSEKLELAAFRFLAIYQHAIIPTAFRVPETKDWPSSVHGFPLGKVITSYRHGYFKLPRSLQLKLKELGVTLEPIRDAKFKLILKALIAHDQYFGDMLVPRYYRIPESEPWPREVWGMHLGNRVRNIRHRRSYTGPKYHKMLEKIGFPMHLISGNEDQNDYDRKADRKRAS